MMAGQEALRVQTPTWHTALIVIASLCAAGIIVTCVAITFVFAQIATNPAVIQGLWDEVAPEEGGSTFLLTDETNLSEQMRWKVELSEGWAPAELNVNGSSTYSHAANSCQMLAFRGDEGPFPGAVDDYDASNSFLNLTFGAFLPLDIQGEPIYRGEHLYIDVPLSGTNDAYEFGMLAFDYQTHTGNIRTHAQITRLFQDNGIVLHAEVDCPMSSAAELAAEKALYSLKISPH